MIEGDKTAVWVAVVAGVPGTIAAIATLVVAIRSAKQIKKVEIATNSMKDALVKTTGEEALARGIKQGKTEERANPGSV